MLTSGTLTAALSGSADNSRHLHWASDSGSGEGYCEAPRDSCCGVSERSDLPRDSPWSDTAEAPPPDTVSSPHFQLAAVAATLGSTERSSSSDAAMKMVNGDKSGFSFKRCAAFQFVKRKVRGTHYRAHYQTHYRAHGQCPWNTMARCLASCSCLLSPWGL